MVHFNWAVRKPLPRWVTALIIVGLVMLFMVFFVLFPPLITPIDHAHRLQCENNLQQIGKALQAWAVDHRQTFPDAFSDQSKCWYDVGNTRTDQWNPVENEGQPPSSRPGDNGQPVQSNTANLWALLAAGLLENPEVCICPEAKAKGLYEADALLSDYKAVRDFRGERFCSYSFQNVLGPYTLTTRADPNLAVAADANPMRRDFWSGAPDGGVPLGITNKKLAEKPHFEPVDLDKQVRFIRHPWELNSPNHNFKGQNVLYLDGHIEWQNNPYCGIKFDNIWLRRRADAAGEPDGKDIESLRAASDVTSYDGTSTLPADSREDSFLVP